MKIIIYTFFFTFLHISSRVNAQIETGESKTKIEQYNNDTTKRNKRFERKSIDGSTEIYFNAAWANSYRKLIPNEDFVPKELGKRADEKPINVWSYGVGFRNYVHKNIVFEGGISILRNGETYSYSGEDSTFLQKTIYTYVAIPVRIQYVTGDQIRFFGGGSFFPEMINKFNQTSKWTNAKNEEKSEVVKDKQALNNMVFSAGINAGIQANLGGLTSIYVMPEYRWQLSSTYTNLNYYKHFARVFSINFGLIYQL